MSYTKGGSVWVKKVKPGGSFRKTSKKNLSLLRDKKENSFWKGKFIRKCKNKTAYIDKGEKHESIPNQKCVMSYKIWNISLEINQAGCIIACIRESAEIALEKKEKPLRKRCTIWKGNVWGFADRKMYAKRHHHLQVSKNTKPEVHYAFCKWKHSMRLKN